MFDGRCLKVGQSKKEGVNLARRDSEKRAKTTTSKTKIAGQTVVMGSDKAQYLKLTMDQIQELAARQARGDLGDQEGQTVEAETCCVHNNSQQQQQQQSKSTRTSNTQISTTDKENNKRNLSLNKDKRTSLQSPKLISTMKAAPGTKSRAKSHGSKPDPIPSNAAEADQIKSNGQNNPSDDKLTKMNGDKPSATIPEEKKGTLESPGLIKDLSGVGGKSAPRKTAAAASSKNQRPAKKVPDPKRVQSPRRKPTPEQKRTASPSSKPSATSRKPSQENKRGTSPTGTPTENGTEPADNGEDRKGSVDSTISTSSISSAEMDKRKTSSDRASVKGSRPSSAAERSTSRTTDPNVKGGFLLPTRAWLSHMGEKLPFTSRSPSPLSKQGRQSSTLARKPLDRSPSPRGRNPSTDSENRRKPAVQRVRKPADKDPSLPSVVKRTASMRAKPTNPAPPVANVKRSASLKKPPGASARVPLKKRGVPTSKKGADSEPVAKKDADSEPALKKEPPPVAPKPRRSRIEEMTALAAANVETFTLQLNQTKVENINGELNKPVGNTIYLRHTDELRLLTNK